MNITQANKLTSEYKKRITLDFEQIMSLTSILKEDYNDFDKKVSVVKDRVQSYINYLNEYGFVIDDDMLSENIRYIITKYPQKFGRQSGGGRISDIEEWINQILLSNIDVQFRENLINYTDDKVNENVTASYRDRTLKSKESSLGNYKTYTRKAIGDTCKWCLSLQGEYTVKGYKMMTYDDEGKLIKTSFMYDYSEVPSDFFKRHNGCDCMIDVAYHKG